MRLRGYAVAYKCKVCGLSFKSIERLKTHICRIDVENPTYSDYYIKNWTVADGCTPLFSSTMKIEIAILHSKMCWGREYSCAELTCDNNIIHLESEKYLQKGKINWKTLSLNLEKGN